MVDFQKKLNKEQLRVVYEGEGPCLVLSGPGSGKTRTLVYRTVYLLQKGVPSSSILLLTFTKKAAKEMLFRINGMASEKARDICGGTFHHVANLFLRRYPEKVGYSSSFVIIDEEDSKSIISSIIKEEFGKKSKEYDIPKEGVIKKINSLAVNSEKRVEDVIQEQFPFFSNETVSFVLRIVKRYKERKKESNVMDYDDLLLNWGKVLSFPEIRKDISEKFKYVMVDEYQDTNKLQDKIIKKIIKKNGNILAVGDDSQSIYSFRAADIDNIINFSKNYPNAKVFKLENNYRSTPEILEMANTVIKNNTKRLEKNLRSVVKKKGDLNVVSFSNPSEQAQYITEYISKNKELSDVAVLFRAHHHAVELEMELTRRNIPYISRGGVRFFEQLHVKDAISFLRIFLNFRDRTSFERIFSRQKGIGDVNAKKISKKISCLEKIEDLFREKNNISKEIKSSVARDSFLKVVEVIESGFDKSISEKIKIFQDFYEKYLEFSFDNAKDRKSDLKKIEEMSFDYEKIEDIISDFSLSEDFSEYNNKEGVVLSTVHQAKGLEWKTVFIISLKEGNFPHTKAIEDDSLEEERRLFYVALTRCKENLFLTYPRYSFKEKYIMPPSRFIKEAQGLAFEDDFQDEEVIENDGEWEMM
jgi:DNA helicase II / ATP-dependent DNA helicase PcrA